MASPLSLPNLRTEVFAHQPGDVRHVTIYAIHDMVYLHHTHRSMGRRFIHLAIALQRFSSLLPYKFPWISVFSYVCLLASVLILYFPLFFLCIQRPGQVFSFTCISGRFACRAFTKDRIQPHGYVAGTLGLFVFNVVNGRLASLR